MKPSMAFMGRYTGQAAFAGVAAVLLMGALALAAIGWRAYQVVTGEAIRYRSYKSLQQEAGQVDSLSTVYSSILKEIRNLRQALPARNQGSHVLNILVEDARKLELGIVGINGLDEIPFAGYRELPFELTLNGSFTDLVRYLHGLETRGMVVRIRRLDAKAEALNKSRVAAKLELSVFVPEAGAP